MAETQDVIIPLSVDTTNVDQSLDGLAQRVESLRTRLSELTSDAESYQSVQTQLAEATNQLASANDQFVGSLNRVDQASESVAENTIVISEGFTQAAQTSETLSESLNRTITEISQSGESAREAAQGTRWYEQTLNDIREGADATNFTLNELRTTQRELRNEQADTQLGSDEWVRLNEDIQLVNDTINEYRNVARSLSNEGEENANTIAGIRAQLRDLNAEWRNTEIGSERFQELTSQIATTTDELKGFESAVGDNRRNVGNYGSALTGVVGQLGLLGTTLPRVAAGFTALASATGLFAGALRLLNNVPVLITLAAIVALIKRITAAFKENEGAMNSLQVALARFNPIIDRFNIILGSIVDGIGLLIDGIVWVLDALIKIQSYFPGIGRYYRELNDEIERSVQLEQQRQKYEHERQQLIQSGLGLDRETAKAQREINTLRIKSTNDSIYSEQKRLEFLNEAIRLETEQAKIMANRALVDLRTFQRQNDLYNLTIEQKQELTRLEVAYQNALQNRDTVMNRGANDVNSFNERILSEQKKINDRAIAESKKNANELSQVQKRYTEILSSEFDNRRNAATKQYNEDLKILQRNGKSTVDLTLAYQKTLTEITRDELANRSKLTDDSLSRELRGYEIYYQELENINEVRSARLNVALIEANSSLIEAQLSGDENLINSAQNRIDILEQQQIDANTRSLQLETEAIGNRLFLLQNALLNEAIIGEERLAIEQEVRDTQLQLDLNQTAIAEDNANRRQRAAQQAADAEVKIQREKAASLQLIQQTVNDFAQAGINLLGENTVASKILGTAQATINTYVGASQALTLPFPANIAAMAATITAGIATVQKIWAVEVPEQGNAGAPPQIEAPNIQPTPEYSAPITETVSNLTSDQIQEINRPERVFVLEEDISRSQNRVNVLDYDATW